MRCTHLLGISAIIEESNNVVNRGYSKVSIKVQSEFNSGSFVVNFMEILSSSNFNAVTNLFDVLGFGGGIFFGLIQLIKYGKGRKITDIKEIPDTETSQVFWGDINDSVIVNNSVINCYESPLIRESLNRTMSPLSQEGFDCIKFSSNNNNPEIVTKNDIEFFNPPEREDEERICIDEGEGVFIVIRSNQDGYGKGWRLMPENGMSFPCTISDKQFLNDVKNGKYCFTSGTRIHARYSLYKKKKIYSVHEYEIKRVFDVYGPNSKIPQALRENCRLFED